MKRYDISPYGSIDEDPSGEMVYFIDAEAELATLRAENALLKDALQLAEALRNKERRMRNED